MTEQEPEGIDMRVYERALLQTDSAHTALWTAVAAMLVHKKICDADDALAMVSFATTRAPKEQRGGIFDSITRSGMRFIAGLKYRTKEEQPDWVKAVISGEAPITNVRLVQEGGR